MAMFKFLRVVVVVVAKRSGRSLGIEIGIVGCELFFMVVVVVVVVMTGMGCKGAVLKKKGKNRMLVEKPEP
mgnify:CR=1 FL=1